MQRKQALGFLILPGMGKMWKAVLNLKVMLGMADMSRQHAVCKSAVSHERLSYIMFCFSTTLRNTAYCIPFLEIAMHISVLKVVKTCKG